MKDVPAPFVHKHISEMDSMKCIELHITMEIENCIKNDIMIHILTH